MQVLIEKEKRLMTLTEHGKAIAQWPIALGRVPIGPKQQAGDGKTPEGRYRICLIKECGKYGRSLGLSYPSREDARAAYACGRIDEPTLQAICLAHDENRRPPWGSPLGGEIYIHEGGHDTDWTQGCIALDKSDMDLLWRLRSEITEIIITA